MEPTYALFMTIANIAGRIVSILLAISIAAGLSVGIVFVTENAFEARPSYIYACYFCGLITAFIPLSTFRFTTCKK